MERQRQIIEILHEISLLDEKNRGQVSRILESQFGFKGELTREELAEWNDENFGMLYGMTSGMKLTREFVPDILKVHGHTEPLSSKVSFGRPKAAENEERGVHHIHRQYGRYAVPKTIERLYELEAELGDQMRLKLGLMLDKQGDRYPCTPPDFIPFAWPGMDGIHYCFVTDFGTVPDLEDAYIAVVSPMDFGSRIWLAARNINDFLRIVCTERSVLFNHFPDAGVYLEHLDKTRRDRADDRDPERMEAIRRLKDAFALTEIDDMAVYIRKLREERDRAICIRTFDTVGVVLLSESGGVRDAASYLPFQLEDAEVLEQMLRHASPEVKLAVIRELQHRNAVPDDSEFFRLCDDILTELELYHERFNLRELLF
ncbi:hypothetical protein KP806_10740 [Paenibacillus sp. N4]|uniref:hypothetical protein n=1 Tax=Paenibacillus vietnamensis TaxID=2590547 RepID=UPI001CD132A0|nr:hypothetical protein [Paenibacillus vietnamensis]MCA0755530.1 hypothetical protein [Paenibacillus vietnamensis]